MEGITNNTANAVSPQGSPKGPRPLKPVLIAFGAVVLLFAGYVLWLAFWSPEAIREFEAQKNLELAQNFQQTYETAMRNDTYGGKTPQETLNLFIDALKKGDIDLASKYFVLKENGEVDEEWIALLNKIKNDGNLERFAFDLEKYNEAKNTFDPYFIFLYKNNNGSIALQVTMRLNKYSGVWKIESL